MADSFELPDPGSKTWWRKSFDAANGQTFTVSVGVIRGKQPGPTCTHIGGQHGMEHTGPIVLREAFDAIDPNDLSGTLFICPAANPGALMLDYEVYPEQIDHEQLLCEGVDGKALGFGKREDLGELNMNRVWPVGNDGMVGQIVRWLWEMIVLPADVIIDHHAVRCVQKPYIFAEEEVIPWTPLLGIECVWCTGPIVKNVGDYPYRRLGMQAINVGKIAMVIEYSSQGRIHEPDRAIGMFAVNNLARAMGMLPGEVVIRKPIWLIEGPYWEHSEPVEPTTIGHARYLVDEYEPIKQGQPIACIYCLQTGELLEELTSPCDGLMLFRNPSPVAKPGQWLFRVGRDVRLLAEPGKPFEVPAFSLQAKANR